jgi:2'-5' RNA ligase
MPRTVVIDELHLTIRVPADLPDDQAEEVRRALARIDFMIRLRHAIRTALRAFPPLAGVSASLTR